MPHNPAHLGISGYVTKPTFTVKLKTRKKGSVLPFAALQTSVW